MAVAQAAQKESTLNEWSHRLCRAVDETARQVLIEPQQSPAPAAQGDFNVGAYISLSLPKGCLRLGLIVSADGCEELSRRFTGTPPMTLANQIEAMCGFVGLVADSMKRDNASSLPDMKVGKPTFILGPIEPTRACDHVRVPITLGAVAAEVDVVRWPAA